MPPRTNPSTPREPGRGSVPKQRKLLGRPWTVLTDGKLVAWGGNGVYQLPMFDTRKQARQWIAISPFRVEYCKPVRVEVYLAK